MFIDGGDIDGNGLASCFAVTNAHHFTLSNTTFHNGKEYGLYIGGKNGGHIYELVCNNIYCKCTMKGLSGNVGIWSDKHDAHFNDCFVVDYTVGMRILGGANRLTRCHLLGGTVPPRNYSAEIGFNIAGDTRLVCCDFFNNKLMGMKKSIAINHEKGKLYVNMTMFRATTGGEVLYSGNAKDVVWQNNTVTGFSKNNFENID